MKGVPMKQYRVRFWHGDQDGREDSMECDSMEQAMELYDSFGGMAEIQKYVEEINDYEAIVYPTFEF